MLNIEMCPDIQLYGCMALMNLTADCKYNYRFTSLSAIFVSYVISAMLNIEMGPDLQLYGCMALINFTADCKYIDLYSFLPFSCHFRQITD